MTESRKYTWKLSNQSKVYSFVHSSPPPSLCKVFEVDPFIIITSILSKVHTQVYFSIVLYRLDYLSTAILMDNGPVLFDGEFDNYDGVTVTIGEHMAAEVFTERLRTSLAHWEEQGKKGIWIILPLEFANLVEAAVSEGFRYHHAEPDYLMLVSWISDTIDTIPATATHKVSVGALVINKDTREVLVVQEKNGYFRDKNMCGSCLLVFSTRVRTFAPK